VEWSFDPRREETADRVRSEIRLELETNARADAIVRLDMIYAEIVSNAIRVECHEPGGDVTVHVMDRGPGFALNPRLPTDVFSECGRGLFIISMFADDFMVEQRAGGGSHTEIVLKRRGDPQ
jgi:anti-sigma regulatory factor (Ser/Thr protein kinase)